MKLNNYSFWVYVLTLGICLTAISHVPAQQGGVESTASLKETISFLSDFITANGRSVPLTSRNKSAGDTSKTTKFESVTGCTVRISSETQMVENKYLGTGIRKEMYEFSLADIEPIIKELPVLIVEGENSGIPEHLSTILLETPVKKELITQTQIINGKSNTHKTFYAPIQISELRDGENQKRIIRALKHGINLCGGKVSPF